MAWGMEGSKKTGICMRETQKPKWHILQSNSPTQFVWEKLPVEDFSEKFDYRVLIKGMLDDTVTSSNLVA